MELIIDGITKLHFKTFYDRKITNIEIKNRGKDDGTDSSYVFTFGEIPPGPNWKSNGMDDQNKILLAYMLFLTLLVLVSII